MIQFTLLQYQILIGILEGIVLMDDMDEDFKQNVLNIIHVVRKIGFDQNCHVPLRKGKTWKEN